MKKPVWIGILFVIVVLGVIIYSSMNLASYRFEACMAYQGRTNCRTASGSTLEFAQRTAISNACADIASGVTDSIACEQSTPSKLTRLK
jgi:capsule polysaccharide export protein KpsE/RkpR